MGRSDARAAPESSGDSPGGLHGNYIGGPGRSLRGCGVRQAPGSAERADSVMRFGVFYEHQNRFEVEGDLSLATRVPEMFGAPPQF